MGLLICLILFMTIFGIIGYKIDDTFCIFGIVAGALIGVLIWCISASYCVEHISNIKLINSTTYKMAEIDGQYWKTNAEGNKEVWYFDEGRELQSQLISKKQIKYSKEISEPKITIKNYKYIGWFIKFWCGNIDDYSIEFSECEVIMPQFN